MDKTQILALYDQDQRRAIAYPGMRREVLPHVVRHIDTSGLGEGLISYSRLDATNADAAIREQVRYFEGLGQDFEWKLYDYDQPPDLRDRLRAYGFGIEEEEAIMVLDLEGTPAILRHPVPHHVRRITDPAGLADVVTIQQQVWGEDVASLGAFLEGTLREHPEQLSVYVASVNGRPASAAWIVFPEHSRFAGLWGGATVRGFRKRGLYTALLAVRAQEAKARQVRYLTVDAGVASRPVLEQFGFERIAYSSPCIWKRNALEQRGAP